MLLFFLQLPLFLWQLFVLAVFAASYAVMKDAEGPLASLIVSSRLVYRLSHVNAAAIGMINQVRLKGV